jgi:hypothetical protein
MAVDLAADILPDPLLSPLVHHVRPKIAQAILGMGRSKMYEALGRGELTAVKDGTRTLITIDASAHIRHVARSPSSRHRQRAAWKA